MRRVIRLALPLAAISLGVTLVACAPDPVPPVPSTPSASSTTAAPAATPTPTPSATPIVLPSDCRSILSSEVIAQFGDLPLNDPVYGAEVGVQPDGSLTCLWGHPGTDTGRLRTTISRMSRGPALDLMNQLASGQQYTCYTPSGGTRCEKSWIDDRYPVEAGRTLFWRQDVMIDTSYINLAPAGYTDSVIAHVFG